MKLEPRQRLVQGRVWGPPPGWAFHLYPPWYVGGAGGGDTSADFATGLKAVSARYLVEPSCTAVISTWSAEREPEKLEPLLV